MKMTDRSSLNKLKKYIEHDELAKFKSYTKRRSVDMIGLQDAHGNSLLHLACSCGAELILRYLIRSGADVLLTNNAGQLPIHRACDYAQRGHKHEQYGTLMIAETDLVLPLIKVNSACLDVENNEGQTARQMLQEFKRRTKELHSSHSQQQHHCQSDTDSSSDSNVSESFHEKLAREMEDEYRTDCGGHGSGVFDADYLSYEQEYETWNAWADRMAKEYASAHQSQASVYRRRRPPTTSQKDTPRISSKKCKLFDQNLAAEREQQRIAMIGLAKLRYERDCIALYAPESTSPIGYSDVPWPHAIIESTLQDAVVSFLLSDLDPRSETYRGYVRLQRVRWHPDRFLHRCHARIVDTDRQRILDQVNAISQILNSIHDSMS